MSIIPSNLRDWFFMNPIVQIAQDARHLILNSANDITLWNSVNSIIARLVPFVIIMVICLIGYYYFKSRSKYFAEDI